MIAAQQDNRKDKAIAAILTALIMALILIFLYFYVIITPNPPFPMSADGGEEINFGIYNEGTGNVENTGIGDATSVVVDKTSTPKEEQSESQDKPFENGEAVLEKKNENPKIKNNETVITPTKTKEEIQKEEEEAAAKSLLNAYTKNKNKGQSGGQGNSGEAGNDGSPDGNPDTHGKGGTGNNPDFTGHGIGPGGTGFSLSGRKILVPPPKVSDGKEEGIVVVYISVDKQGNVVDADPNGKGTTTSSGVLKSKARQAALQAKFSPSDKFDIQRGSIVFKFQF